jgi:uncharacterized protein YdeI (YjbR/CyaY-like superfamily)
MGKKDKRVDAYIAKAKPFAQPILKHLRKLIHQANPGIEETIKWGMPFFDYKGPFCNIASFKEHAVFGFWKTALLKDPKGVLEARHDAMGSLGRIASLNDLPSDKVIMDLIKQAKKLNDDDVKLTTREKKPSKPVAIPNFFKVALSQNKKALAHFEKFPPGQKKEYIVWLTEAKAEETREKRLENAIEWISQGKIKDWKYLKK